MTYYHIDAFDISGKPFSGNPAGVAILEEWPEDAVLQSMAAEHNLSETAFFLRAEAEAALAYSGADDAAPIVRLRWFSPTVEIDLCGHATLATAHAIWNEMGATGSEASSHACLRFSTRSGNMLVRKASHAADDASAGGNLALDFPSRPASACDDNALTQQMVAALGHAPQRLLKSARDYLLVYATEAEVRTLRPDFATLPPTPGEGLIVTAPGDAPDLDYVCRFFAPSLGVDEDPVTGSAQCTLIPYWTEALGKTTLHSQQISARGGAILGELRGDRVAITGQCRTYLRGAICGATRSNS